MPYKSLSDKKKHNKEYHAKRYIEDLEFKKRKKTATEDWRKNKGQDYKEYIYQNRRLKKQYKLWIKYRTEWKSRKNKQTYFQVLDSLLKGEQTTKGM